MSCRVLKRDMELAMLDALVREARSAGVETVVGYYLPSKKNSMVADFYDRLGFTLTGETADASRTYRLSVNGYQPQNRHIRLLETIPA